MESLALTPIAQAARAHAILSPSGADRWMSCIASSIVAEGMEDSGSEFADDGTASHTLGTWSLEQGKDAFAFIGVEITVAESGRKFVVDQERAAYVQEYVDKVRELTGADGVAFYEQAVPLQRWTLEEGAEGTSDAVIIRGNELIIVDLKYGIGVRVDAQDNKQLHIYALGALDKFADFCDEITQVRLCICQPRNGGFSEWVVPIEDLLAFGQDVRDVARTTQTARQFRGSWEQDHTSGYFQPSEKACMWCRFKPKCKALAKHVEVTLGAGFEDLTKADATPPAKQVTHDTPVDDLAIKMGALDLIEDWVKAVRAEVERRLLSSIEVPGYKLVQGNRGNRRWGDPDAVELAMKAARLTKDQMYDFSLISPTTAEKVFEKERPKLWAKFEALVTQSEGKPHVAPVSDRRPAIITTANAEGFTNLADDPSA